MGADVQERQVTGCLPLCPFPPLHWWVLALQGAPIDAKAPYQKQTLRNRLVLSGPQGRHTLTFPVQRLTNKHASVMLSGHQAPIHAWRTLKTSYGNSPFFDLLEDELKQLWWQHLPVSDEHGKELNAWNRSTIQWMCELCDWPMPVEATESPALGATDWDLRLTQALRGDGWSFARYTQPFEPQHGFIPGCSIIDALFVLGPSGLRDGLFELATPQ